MSVETTDSVSLSRAEYHALLADRALLAKLQQQIALLMRQRFGRSAENADQLLMFGSDDVEAIEQEVAKPDEQVKPGKKVSERQRLALPKNLATSA